LEKKVKKDKQVGVIDNVNLNQGILHSFVQLITSDGNNLGKMKTSEALLLAEKSNLDLVLVSSPNEEGVPVAKIMNYSKKVYEDKKKNNTVKKKSVETKTKEIRLSIKIGRHDLENKIEQSAKLLVAGYRVKLVLIMKGRERSLRDTIGMGVINTSTDLLINIVFQSSNRNVSFEQDNENNHGICRIFFLKK
jgi:translation initiation factor IF-3